MAIENQLERVDAMLDFGLVTASGCENTVALANTSAGGMDVVFTFDSAVGTAAALTVEGSETEGGSYTAIAAGPSKTYAAGEVVRVTIPRGAKAKFIKVKGATCKASLDTYVGK